MNLNLLRAFVLVLVAFYGCSKDDSSASTPEEPKVLPEVTTGTATSITKTAIILSGATIKEGSHPINSRGFVYGTSANPTVENSAKVIVGDGLGNFDVAIKGLIAGTTYYAKVFATSDAGTAYGEEIVFTTLAAKPVVFTVAVTNIKGVSARTGGNITDDSGFEVTERGVCWNTEPTPTIDNFKLLSTTTGSGAFTIDAIGLNKSTTYYIRAYAINEKGISYGEELTFTTAAK